MIKKMFNLLMTCVVIFMPVFSVKAEGITVPPIPLYPPDCGAMANTPYRSGNLIVGSGGLNCTSTKVQIDINVELASSNGGHTYNSLTCYNTRSCTVTVTTTYVSGLSWQTRTSGYTQGYQWYNSSAWQYIP